MRRTSLLLGLVVVGCNGSVADITEITFTEPTVRVDSNCVGGCGGDTLEVTLSLAEDISAGASAELDLQQYRVDYTISALADDGEEVPYFAAAFPEDTVIGFGEELVFSVSPAGNSQRAWVYTRAGSATIAASAVLTLEGYDQRNELVQVTSPAFNINFYDVEAGSGSVGSGDTGLF